MKKVVKSALLAVFFVAIALCFVGCGGGAGGNPAMGPAGRELTGYVIDIDPSEQDYVALMVLCNSMESLSLDIFWTASDGINVAIIYDNPDPNTVSAMTKAFIGGQTPIEYPDYSEEAFMDGWFGFKNLTREQLLSKIPSSGPMTIYVQSASHPDKNTYCTFTADKVSALRNWIINHE